MPTRLLRRLAVAAAAPIALAACSSSSSSTTTTTAAASATTAAPTTAAPTTTTAALSGSLKVFAAASLTGAFNAAKTAYATSDPALALTFNFAGSNTLVVQIHKGAT